MGSSILALIEAALKAALPAVDGPLKAAAIAEVQKLEPESPIAALLGPAIIALIQAAP